MKILLKYKNIVAGLILIIATILNMMYFNKLSHKFWCGIYLLSVADIMWFITSVCLLFNFKKITPTLLIITGIAYLIKPDGCIGWTRISSILGCVSIALLGIYQIIRPKSKKHSILNYLWIIPLGIFIYYSIGFYDIYSYYIPIIYFIGISLLCIPEKKH